MEFQSHAGSIEAAGDPGGGDRPGPFQSHAGSIEAAGMETEKARRIFVSIPRWFD